MVIANGYCKLAGYDHFPKHKSEAQTDFNLLLKIFSLESGKERKRIC